MRIFILLLSIFSTFGNFSKAQTKNEPVPDALAIMGRGIQSDHQLLLLACVGKNQESIVPTCNEIRMILVQENSIPQWAGFTFPAMDLVRVQQDLQKWYSETRVSGFFRFFDSNDIFALTEKNGWNWSNNPLQVNGTIFKRILSAISAYSYVENTKASAQNRSDLEQAFAQIPKLVQISAPVDLPKQVAVASTDPCEIDFETHIQKAMEDYTRNKTVFDDVQKRFSEVEVIAESTRKKIETMFATADQAMIVVDEKRITVRTAREFIAFVDARVGSSAEPELELKKFENPLSTTFGLTAESTRSAVSEYYKNQFASIQNFLRSEMKDSESQKWDTSRHSKIYASFKSGTVDQFKDIEVCLPWSSITKNVDASLISDDHYYCYSLLNEKNSFNLWKGVQEKDIFITSSIDSTYPHLDAWQRLSYNATRGDDSCRPNRNNLHLRYYARARLMRIIDASVLKKDFAGPTLTYARLDGFFNTLWLEYTQGKKLPTLPQNPTSRRGERQTDDILEYDIPHFMDGFSAYVKKKYAL